MPPVTRPARRAAGLRRALVPLAAALALPALAAPAAHAAWELPPVTLDEGADVGSPAVAVGASGRGAVAWLDRTGTDVVKLRRVAADGSLGPVQTLSDPADGDATDVDLDMDADGDAVATWAQGAVGARIAKARTVAASGALGPVTDLSVAAGVSYPRVDVNAAGDGWVVWQRLNAGNQRIEARRVSSAGALGALEILTNGAPSAYTIGPAVAPDGSALLLWTRSNPEAQLQGSRVPAGGVPQATIEIAGGARQANGGQVVARPDGSFVVAYSHALGAPDFDSAIERVIVPAAGPPSAPETLSAAGSTAHGIALASAADGTTTVAWRYRQENSDGSRVQARRLDAAGQPGPALPDLSEPVGSLEDVRVGIDADGDAIVAWAQEDPLFQVLARRVTAGGALEPAGGPQILAEPTTENAREASHPRLAVAPNGDALLSLSRGGGGEPTDQVQLARYRVPVAPPAGGGGAGGTGENPAADTTRPVVSRLRLSRTRFAVGGKRTARSAARVKRGTTIRFHVSEGGVVRLAIQKLAPGRRAGKRCVRPTRRNAASKRCTRAKTVMRLTRTVEGAGVVKVAFSGRVGRRALKPGRYRVAVTAADAAGNRTAKAVRRGFRVVRG